MSATKEIKLFKLASELNMGRDAIVDFLTGKGLNIQNKPTTSLTPEMVDLVYEKFKREKIVAEKQREKLEKHHILRNAPGAEHKSEKEDHEEVLESHSEPVQAEEKPVVKETIPEEKPKTEPKVEEKVKEKVEEKPLEIVKPVEVKEEIKQEKKPKTEEVPVEVKVETKKAEEKSKTEVITEEKPKAETKSEDKKKEEKPIQEPKPKAEEKIETKKAEEISTTETKIEQTPKAEERLQTEAKREEKPKTEIKPEEKKKDERPKLELKSEQRAKSDERYADGKRTDKPKKKRQKLAEVTPGHAPKLRGLTIVGKIELKKNRSEQSDGDRNRGIRKDRDDKRGSKDRYKGDRGDNRGDNRGKKPDRPLVEIKQSQFTQSDSKTGKQIFTKKPEPAKVTFGDELVRAQVKVKVKDKIKSKEEKHVKKHKKAIREQISSVDVEKAIKETMAGMDSSQGGSSRAKIKMKKKIEREEKAAIKMMEAQGNENLLKLTEFVTTSELAHLMNVNPNQIIMKCISLGLMVTINQRLDKDTLMLISEDFGYRVEFIDEQTTIDIEVEADTPESLKPRAPIVTIMGHVDHGKTKLLDFIRNSNVVAGEAGGITQHIGAYQVELKDGRMISFLDTPGHAAFTAMRARGVQVTDIVVLVVAADDGVMPQTMEAISHAKAAGVPMVIAINKIDKLDANPDRIKQQLSDQGILVEDWGGKFQSAEISAKAGINIEQLLEKILIEAELLDLKANPDRKATGAVIEAVMKKGFGPVATIMVQKGTLKVGDAFVAGVAHGKVRRLLDEREKDVTSSVPADPVLVVGFNTLPEAGDTFIVTHNEIEARNVAQERAKLKREQEMRQIRKISLDDISQRISEGNIKDLKVIIKGDVSGSVEALSDSLLKLGQDEVRVQIIHRGVGTILETDVTLASASEAVIIGFNVSVDMNARKLANVEKVDIRQYNIIYDCINEINLALEGLLTPDYQEETTAVIEVRQLFKISRVGTIAGCYVQSGKINKNENVRVLREGLLIYSGSLKSLKREKDDVKEVDAGYECGIMISGFNDYHIGDSIESYKVVEIKRKLR